MSKYLEVNDDWIRTVCSTERYMVLVSCYKYLNLTCLYGLLFPAEKSLFKALTGTDAPLYYLSAGAGIDLSLPCQGVMSPRHLL